MRRFLQLMRGYTCSCLEEESKAQTISNGQGITGKIQVGGDLKEVMLANIILA